MSFTAVFTQSNVYLLDGIDKGYSFQNKTSNSLLIVTRFSAHEHRFLNNSTILILLALDTRIRLDFSEFGNERISEYVSKSVEWNQSDGINAHEKSTFINPS